MTDNYNENSDENNPYNVLIKGAAVNTCLIAVNVALFIISRIDGGVLVEKGILSAASVIVDKEYYRLILAAFLHVDFVHIFNNMLIIAGIGAAAERAVGHWEYLILYMLSAIGGNVFSMLIDIHNNNIYSYSMGASGAVFGVMGAVLLITFIGRNKLRKGSTFLKRLAFIVIYSVISGFGNDGINVMAHIGGLICGIIFAVIFSAIKGNRIDMEAKVG